MMRIAPPRIIISTHNSGTGEANLPTVSKFTASRKSRILQILRAGGSRREAAKAAGIDPVTLSRWIETGRTSPAPNGRWAEFRKAVLEAEGAPPELQVLQDRFEVAMSTPESAWRFIERLERQETRAPAPSGLIVVEVTFAPFAPPIKEGA
jgi:hypothetical protein